MQFYKKNKTVSTIYHRAICLSISNEFAQQQKAEIFSAQLQNDKQQTFRRELLAVEQEANHEKIVEQHNKMHFKHEVTHKLLDKVYAQITEELSDKDALFSDVLKVAPQTCEILEVLSVKAASLKRITPLVADLPWLSNDLLSLVNKPQYRKNSEIQVNKPNLAVSYVGLDNLKTIMPTFIFKQWLPNSSSAFPMMKRKLWQDSLATALASKVLAKNEGFDEYQAFTAGMLSNIGIIAIQKIFTKVYNSIHQADLKEAYINRDKHLHDTLNEIEVTPEFILEIISTHSSQLTSDIIELMQFKRLYITNAMHEISSNTERKSMTKLSQILIKAKSYIAFRNLAKERIITTEESKSWLSHAGLTAKEVSLLKKSDIDHIKLNFGE